MLISRFEALPILRGYIGKDLRQLANEFGIQVFVHGKKNKGWAGLVLERCISLDPNCRQAPNGLGWELKTTSLRLRDDRWRPKETLAVTMINPERDVLIPFEESHLWQKLKRTIVCGRVVKSDYELIQQTIRTKGFGALSRSLCEYIEPGTKAVATAVQRARTRRAGSWWESSSVWLFDPLGCASNHYVHLRDCVEVAPVVGFSVRVAPGQRR